MIFKPYYIRGMSGAPRWRYRDHYPGGWAILLYSARLDDTQSHFTMHSPRRAPASAAYAQPRRACQRVNTGVNSRRSR